MALVADGLAPAPTTPRVGDDPPICWDAATAVSPKSDEFPVVAIVMYCIELI